MASLNKINDLKLNTIMLYLLTFSNYFFALATIPYLTRILQPELYGLIGFAMAIMVYFQLIIDFGFMLSATQRVAENYSDCYKLRKITTSVLGAKVVLSVISLITLVVIDLWFDIFSGENVLFGLFFLNTVFSSLIPDYLYRGLEKMRLITIRTVAVKALFTVLIYVFLQEPSQYCLVPLFYLFGSIAATLWSYIDIYKRFNIYFIRITENEIFDEIKISFPFFVSRIATTIYGASNIMMLKYIYPTNMEIGYYTSSDKIVSIARSASSPIADSLYPYMVKNRDYKLMFKILLWIMPLVLIGCIFLFVYAVPICMIIFGEQYAETGHILRYMIPLMVIVLPNYVFGFPALVPLGLARIANLSNVIGAVIQIIGLCFLFFNDLADVYNVCILTSITEGAVLLIRITATMYGIKRNKTIPSRISN